MKDRGFWFSRRAIALHVVIIVIVPTFIALCVWQVHRALDGNDLSWAYVFEWPFFAGYAVYMWWRLVHEQPEVAADAVANTGSGVAAGTDRNGSATPELGALTVKDLPTDDAEDVEEAEDLAAYNAYLADLAERGKPKHW